MVIKRRFHKVEAMERAVKTASGASSPALRNEVINYACDPDHYSVESIPENLRTYIDKVVRYAYRVTDKDMQALLDGGYTEEVIFELTVSAAMGASMRRFQKALDLLEE